MFPLDVLRLISEYLVDTPYKLVDGLPWSIGLLRNPYAVDLIDDYLSAHPVTLYESSFLVRNKNPRFLSYIPLDQHHQLLRPLCAHHSKEAVALIRHYPCDDLDWIALSGNPYAIELLQENQDRIDWQAISLNLNAYGLILEGLLENRVDCWGCFYLLEGVHSERLIKELLHKFPEAARFNSRKLFLYTEERSIDLCSREECFDQISGLDPSMWSIYGLSQNTHPGVSSLIERWLELYRMDPDDVSALCESRNQRVLEMVEQRFMDFVNPVRLSRNPEAIEMLLRNPAWILWEELAENPSPRVMEVVMRYLWEFLGNTGMYARREVLEVDMKRYKRKIEEYVEKNLCGV